MSFQSYVFLFLFLPVTWILFHIMISHKREYGQLFLVIASLIFYGYAGIPFLCLLIVNILCVYTLGKRLTVTKRKSLVALGILLNLAELFYFKYTNFFLGAVNDLFSTDFAMMKIFMPLGISFYIFQQIAFLVDCYRGKIKSVDLLDYMMFATFFPKIIQGPIMVYQDFVQQLPNIKRHVDWQKVCEGISLFIIGLAKKVLIADVLALIVNQGYSDISALDTMTAWVVTICFTLQIYFDFSGYSDMAIGIGKLFQVELPMNFRAPYRALSIQDFWSRWHMTLTNFFTRYVYIPLGGNRKGKLRTYVNVMIIFTLSGLWHGAAYTFLLWGILHGVLSCVDKGIKDQWAKLPVILRWSITMLLLNFTWVFFRAGSLQDACSMIQTMLRWSHTASISALFQIAATSEMWYFLSGRAYLAPMMIFVLAVLLCVKKKTAAVWVQETSFSWWQAIVLSFLLFYSVLSLSNVSTFLYTQF